MKLRYFCPSIDSWSNYNTDFSKSSERKHKTNPYDQSGLIKIFWGDKFSLYGQNYLGFYSHINIHQLTRQSW